MQKGICDLLVAGLIHDCDNAEGCIDARMLAGESVI